MSKSESKESLNITFYLSCAPSTLRLQQNVNFWVLICQFSKEFILTENNSLTVDHHSKLSFKTKIVKVYEIFAQKIFAFLCCKY